MVTKSHLRLSTSFKLIIWLAVLFTLWQFLQREAVADSILAFLFAGVVPGTNIVLSPDAVIRLAACALGFLALLLFLQPAIRVVRRRRRLGLEVSVATDTSTIIAWPELRKAIQTAHTEIAAAKPEKAVRRHIALPDTSGLHRRTSQTLQKVRGFWARALVTYAFVRQAVVLRAKVVLALIKRNATSGWHYALQQSRAFWQWLVPRLWQFDSWLAKQVHQSNQWFVKKANAHDTGQLLLAIGREYKESFAKFRPKVLWSDAKRDFHEIKVKLTDLYSTVKKLLTS